MGADGSVVRGAETDEFPFGWNSCVGANLRLNLLTPIQYAAPSGQYWIGTNNQTGLDHTVSNNDGNFN